jgi:hypothetical protein
MVCAAIKLPASSPTADSLGMILCSFSLKETQYNISSMGSALDALLSLAVPLSHLRQCVQEPNDRIPP